MDEVAPLPPGGATFPCPPVASADQDGSIHYQLYQVYLKLGRNDDAKAALAVSEGIRSRQKGVLLDLP